MDLLLLGLRILLSAVFVLAGVAKLLNRAGTRRSMRDFGVARKFVAFLSVTLPVFEVAAGVALIPSLTAWWGAASTLTMLFLFTIVISINLAKGRKPPCHCFGQLSSKPLGWPTLARNAAFLLCALFVVLQGRERVGASLAAIVALLVSPPATLVAVCSLALLSALQFWLLLNVMRQNGRLLSRIEAVETKSGMGSTDVSGVPVGAPVPTFSLTDLEGAVVTLDERWNSAATVVLFFFEPGCPGCEELLPEVGEWQSKYNDRLSIVPISGGDVQAIRQSCGPHVVRDVLVQKGGDVSETLLVRATPGAIAVANGRIASAVVTGGDAIRRLIHESALPRVSKGQRAPSLPLSSLDGRAVDLSRAVRGRRTLLLLWSPFCGFCREMLGDLKTWENDRPSGAPDLVIVSTGSAAANRSQGLSSSILLDSHQDASHIFGADGTPSAVLLDEEGIVISGVMSGRDDVLELAGVH